MNTTRTRPALIPFWWMAWLGLLLLVFGGPLLVGRFMEISGEATRLALLEGRGVSASDLDVLARGRMRIASWVHTSSLYNDLSLVALERAEQPSMADSKETFYQEAEGWQLQALKVSPADPYGWFRLAYLLYIKKDGAPQAAEAWRQSLSSAPYEPRLLLPRLQMALALGETLDESSRHQIPRLVREAWGFDPSGLAKVAKAGNFSSVVEEALRDDPQGLKHFQDQLDLLR
ncbi:MAG: hypothetical protein WC612_00870 [Bdellovibrionales bacterium]